MSLFSIYQEKHGSIMDAYLNMLEEQKSTSQKQESNILTEEVEILSEDILMEDRIDFLKNQYRGKLSTTHDPFATHVDHDAIVDHFAGTDPTKKKIYTQWILNQYQRSSMSPDELTKRGISKQPHLKQEDAGQVNDVLTNFDKYRSKLPEKDINKYATLADVQDAVHPHLGSATSKKDAIKNLNHPDVEKKYDSDRISIYELKGKQGSKDLFGGGCENGKTDWCTADNRDEYNMFDRYHEQGPLHVIHDKSNGDLYQYHVASGQFMDAADKPAQDNLEKYMDIMPHVHKAWDEQPSLWREKH